jgi:hypothetical protein
MATILTQPKTVRPYWTKFLMPKLEYIGLKLTMDRER